MQVLHLLEQIQVRLWPKRTMSFVFSWIAYLSAVISRGTNTKGAILMRGIDCIFQYH